MKKSLIIKIYTIVAFIPFLVSLLITMIIYWICSIFTVPLFGLKKTIKNNVYASSSIMDEPGL